MAFRTAIVVLISCAACHLIESKKFISEKPEFLVPCDRTSSDFSSCLTAAFQHIFTDWKNGVPGSEDAQSLDPLFVEKVSMLQDGSDASLRVELQNLTVSGLGTTVVQNVTMKENGYSFKMTYSVPKLLQMKGSYTARGNFLLFKFDTSGTADLDLENSVFTVIAKVKLQKRDGHAFFDIQALKYTMNNIEKVHINFTNLFPNKELTQSTNQLFNENWQSFYEIVRPTNEDAVSEVLLGRFRDIFDHIPAEYFVSDATQA